MGLRKGTDIIVFFSVDELLEKGIKLYASMAHCVLTPDIIPPEFILSVKNRQDGTVIYADAFRVGKLAPDEVRLLTGKSHVSQLAATT